MTTTEHTDAPAASGDRPRPGVRFADRADAGRRLASRLAHLRSDDVVVLGLFGGGVAVAREVAAGLDAALDAVVVGHIPRPFQPSVAMAAVAEDGVLVVDDAVVNGTHIGLDRLAAWEVQVRGPVDRRAAVLRERPDRPALTGATAIVVGDGFVTGLAARAACRVARHRGAGRVVVAAPVVAASAVAACRREDAEVVWIACPPGTPRSGDHYDDFPDVDEAAAAALLDRAPTR